MLAEGNQILEYIPQRDPIVMVDSLLELSEKECKTGLSIKSDNIFVKNNELQESGIIENIAQSSALMVGYQAKQNNEEVKRGFIGAVKKFKLVKLPNANSKIETIIEVQTQVMNVSVVNGSVFQNGELLASCTMNIFLEEE